MQPNNDESEKNSTMNYNDRMDGYGFGESESRDCSLPYEHDKHFTKHSIDTVDGCRSHLNEPFARNNLGLRNPYGPIDQYSFRDVHIRPRHDLHDQQILDDLREAFRKNSELNALDVEFFVHRGHVHLEGEVESESHRNEIQNIVEDIKGVEKISNDIQVFNSRSVL
jgi:hypothetical protein